MDIAFLVPSVLSAVPEVVVQLAAGCVELESAPGQLQDQLESNAL